MEPRQIEPTTFRLRSPGGLIWTHTHLDIHCSIAWVDFFPLEQKHIEGNGPGICFFGETRAEAYSYASWQETPGRRPAGERTGGSFGRDPRP